MRIALGLEYDGSGFCGWQSQPRGNTVQDALERALSEIAGAAVRAHCAGRTDAGVHALAQVVHFDAPAARPPNAWVRGVNAHLPGRIAVRWSREVADEFHARFSARSRSYRYVLYNHAVRPALLDGRVGWFHLPLDVDAMRAGAARLLGERDFTAFRAAECEAATPVRLLQRAEVTRRGDCVLFDFRANAFLHHMVRNMVGALVYVGKGAHPPEWIAELIAGRDRSLAAPTFPPHGLYLSAVEYEARWQLPRDGRVVAPFDPLDPA
ncbi:MAG TPA: tRNA pseudouridine(38-40) synthase TruA [Candidatus Desulfobacillus sp.]|nr:tRNA pseudouridine(38-40) synthase TruA [Candidatus Desulfobacillus sp.]